MYSRNGRDSREYYGEEGMTEEEYEIYKYNIPPRYDGSRFRSRKNERMGDSSREERFTERREAPSEHFSHQDPQMPVDIFCEEKCFTDNDSCMENYCSDCNKKEEALLHGELCSCECECSQVNDNVAAGDKQIKLPEWLRLGSEEMLILTVIFILSGECGVKDDIIVLLALILLAG